MYHGQNFSLSLCQPNSVTRERSDRGQDICPFNRALHLKTTSITLIVATDMALGHSSNQVEMAG